MRRGIYFLYVWLIALSWTAQAMTYIWIEGEEATTHSPDLSTNHSFVPRHPALSGGVSLGGSGTAGETFVEFETTIPEAGTYDVTFRKFWHHGPFRWRFGDDDWQVVDRLALMDNIGLDRIHMNINWVFAGSVELPAGPVTLRLEQIKDGPFVIDCLVISKEPFFPQGALKPGERSGKQAPGFFAWEPPPDPLNADNPLDLRHLNEAAAGQHGFVQRDGDRFTLGNGEPVRFWMVQADLRDMQNRQIDRWARRLAKYGVNLVRMQFSDFFNARAHADEEAFSAQLERLHYVVAALKQQGIYAYFGHLYWQTHNDINAAIHPGFDQENAIALLIFSERFQDWYVDYVRALMEPVNPYTGLSLAADPAVAFFEIWNESNLLFWTFNPQRMNPVEVALLEASFADWLTARYGSPEQALDHWGPDRHAQVRTPDRLDEGRMGLYSIGHLGGADWAVAQRVEQRAADQLRWMIESTMDFYQQMTDRLRTEVGLGSLMAGSNWKTVDERLLGGLDRHTYTATDVVLRNAYFSPDYAPDGNPRFHAVDEGDTFRGFSALKPPATPGPLFTPLIADHPFMITENNWTRPLRYRAEWPVLVATYAAMQGVDGWNFFTLGSAEWQHTMAVWDLNNPTILGQFPATALMFRRGDVTTPDTAAVHEHINLNDAYRFKGTALYAGGGRDVLWVDRIGDKEGAAASGPSLIDPRAFWVGPVRQTFSEEPSRVDAVDLQNYIDEDKHQVRSLTDELAWHFDLGLVTVQTVRAQGTTGFLKDGGRLEFPALTIESQNAYGTLLAVALDDRPLRTSQRILVQAATWDQPYGFATEPQADGFERITQQGGYPLNVEKIDARITLKGSGARRVTILDENGDRTDRPATTTLDDNGDLHIQLPADAIYTLIEAAQ